MATIKGNSDSNSILGQQDDDTILGGRGSDTIDGGNGNDRILADYGDDLVNGGEGNDSLFGEHGNDTLDGGTGNDRVSGGRGDDLGLYDLSGNEQATDYYDGGNGNDTLRLHLTYEQAGNAVVLADLDRFRQFLVDNNHPDRADNPVFQFTAFDLSARNWEKLEVLVDPPPELPAMSISDAQVTEGGVLVFVVAVDRADPGSDITATCTISFDPPQVGKAEENDLAVGTPLIHEVRIAAGDTQAEIHVPTMNDALPEGSETFTVTLSAISANARAGDTEAVGTIIDDEPTPPVVSITDASTTEGGSLVFVVSLDKADAANETRGTYTIAFSPAAIGAASPDDLVPQTLTTGEVVIPAGQTSTTIVLDTVNDLIIEGPESFSVLLSALSSNVQPGRLQATGTIVDDEQVECGYTWGDPHYVTADGLVYDMQSCGEFVLVETSSSSDPNPVIVQTRTALYGPNVSVNTAVATLVDGHRVTINTYANEPLRIDGSERSLAPGESTALGAGRIHFDGSVYSITYPSSEHLVVSDRGSYIDVRFCASADRPDGSLRGLLGNFDGNAANDLATRDGAVLPTRPTFEQLYRSYADSWRITQSESLFDYAAGETTSSFGGSGCPLQKTSLASLAPDKVAAAIALLDAAGITDPALREAAILDYVLTGDPSFIASAGQVAAPEEAVKVIDPMITWTHGGAVIIGSTGAASAFSIGTDAPSATGVEWTGAAASDNWSDAGNWSPGAPVATDAVLFTSLGADGVNRVDQPFTIASLHYMGDIAPVSYAADHVTDLNGSSTLTVSGDVTIGVANQQARVNLTIANAAVVTAHVADLNVGVNASGGGKVTSNLTVTSGARLDAADTAHFSIARVTDVGWQGRAEASLVLGSGSTIDLGTLATPATLNIGWNESVGDSGWSSYANFSSATGTLDATNGTLTAELSELNVGRTAGRGTASGSLIIGQGTTLNTTVANFGIGGTSEGGASGTLEVRGGSLRFAGADTNLNFGSGSLAIADGVSFTLGDPGNRLDHLRLGYNLSGIDLADTTADLTNDQFSAYLDDELSIARVTDVGWQGRAEASLVLGSGSTIDLGTLATPATLNIGWNESVGDSGWSSYANFSSATGTLDATNGTLTAELSELNVGRTAGRGTASGSLIIGQGTTLNTTVANFGIGGTSEGGASGTLEVRGGSLRFAGADTNLNFGSGSLAIADGVSFTLGDPGNRLDHLRLGYNLSGIDLADTTADLTNDQFSAYLDDELSIARVTDVGWQGRAEASLVLGSGSTIDLGTLATPATLNIGWNESVGDSGWSSYANFSSATGTLDATNGTLTAELSELNVGRTAGRGTASGSLIIGQGTTLNTTVANFGIGGTSEGGASGTLEVRGGSLRFAGADTNLNFGSGSLAIADGVSFTLGDPGNRLDHLRLGYNLSGIDLADTTADLTNDQFSAYLDDELSIARVTDVGWQGRAEASLVLGSGSTIDLGTLATPATLNIGWNESVGDSGWSSYANFSSATGTLDATNGTLTAELSELNVGRTAGRGTASGSLIIGQGTTLNTTVANFGIGGTSEGGASGTLEVRGGSLRFAGADTNLNFGSGSLAIADGVSFTLGDPGNRLDHLRLGYNLSGIDLADTTADLTNDQFSAYLDDELSIARVTDVGWQGRAEASLVLGSGSTIDLGTLATPATLNIGWNESVGDSGWSSYANFSSATGTLDATNGTLTAELSELNVGRTAGRGTASGSLIIGQGTTLNTTVANFGIGGTSEGGASGTLEVRGGSLRFAGADTNLNFGSGSLAIADGVSFTLGDPGNRLDHLRLGYNLSGIDLADTTADLTNDQFSAYLDDELSIARVTDVGWQGRAEASLVLGSGSTIDLGTLATPATLNIGWNESVGDSGWSSYANFSSATGTLDATNGTLTAELSELNVGRTAGRGTASGSLIIGNGLVLQADTVNVGMGPGASGTVTFVDGFSGSFDGQTVKLASGLFDFADNTLRIGASGGIAVQTFSLEGGLLSGATIDLDTAANLAFTGGALDVATFNGTLVENGGTLAPGGTGAGQTTINGDWLLSASGTLQITLAGTSPATGYDQIIVNGAVDLASGGAGGTLDLVLEFAPQLNDHFVIVANDGSDATAGTFLGLTGGSTIEEVFAGSTYTFSIDYGGDDGNDIVLTVSAVAASIGNLSLAMAAADGDGASAAGNSLMAAGETTAALLDSGWVEAESRSAAGPADLPAEEGCATILPAEARAAATDDLPAAPPTIIDVSPTLSQLDLMLF